MDAKEIERDLNYYTGTEKWTRYSSLFRRTLLTDGALFVAEECKAYWLMDAISSWQTDKKVKGEGFQFWQLTKDDKGGAVLTCEDGNENEVARQVIDFTDFPLDSIKLYASNEEENLIILLPSEY
jgi:hypothetical protein